MGVWLMWKSICTAKGKPCTGNKEPPGFTFSDQVMEVPSKGLCALCWRLRISVPSFTRNIALFGFAFCFALLICFQALGLELRAYTVSHSTSPVL
jgi:hypothetical protein